MGSAMGFVIGVAPFNSRAIANNAAKALKLLGIILTVPAGAALALFELRCAAIFAGLGAAVWSAGFFSEKLFPTEKDLEYREALVVSALSYLFFAAVCAVIYLPWSPFIDCFFESMSGLTTTGLSVIDLERLPKSVLFFRAYSQWIGGIGIVVLTLAVFLQPGKTAHQLYSADFGKENLLGNVIATSQVLMKIYLLMTALGFLAYWAAGMGAFDALLHIFTTLSTGGFSSHPQSIGFFDSTVIELTVAVFMVLGATSFSLFYLLRMKRVGLFLHDLQTMYLLGFILLGTLLFLFWGAGGTGSISQALFRAVSALTTTGFNLTDPGAWSDRTKFVSSVLMIIGGSAGSTAGGIKLFRFILLVKLSLWSVNRLLLPEEAVLPLKYGALTVSDGEIKQIVGFFLIYIAILCLSTMIFAAAGYPLSDALFECASALGTVGLSTGVTASTLKPGLKLLLILNMWIGRLEILPVVMLITQSASMARRRTT